MPLLTSLATMKAYVRKCFPMDFQKLADFAGGVAEHLDISDPRYLQSPESGRQMSNQLERIEQSKPPTYHLQPDVTKKSKVPPHQRDTLCCSNSLNSLIPSAQAQPLPQSTPPRIPATGLERQIDRQHGPWRRPSPIKESKADFLQISQKPGIHGDSSSLLLAALETFRQ